MDENRRGPGLPWTVGVAIPAAGMGTRMGGLRKPFMDLSGKPLLHWALRPFLQHSQVTSVVVALGEDDFDAPPTWLVEADPFVLLALRGVERDDLLARLHAVATETRGPTSDADVAREAAERARRLLAALDDPETPLDLAW